MLPFEISITNRPLIEILVFLSRVGYCLDKMFLNQENDITAELEHNMKQLGNILEFIFILMYR